jgi:predicted CXXCH cytochrome family protein
MNRFGAFFAITVAASFVLAPVALSGSIIDTKHNLSCASNNEVRAEEENRICIFCHAPHSSRGMRALWNRRDSDAVYDIYESSSVRANIGQPTGSSRLCLSCHDGTIAVGSLHASASPIRLASGQLFLDRSHGSVGISLRDDHPISFLYDGALVTQDRNLVPPVAVADLDLLDRDGQVQCTSCHDPHHDDLGAFLRFSTKHGVLCNKCHDLTGWNTASHSLDEAEVTAGCGGLALDAAPETVASRSCQSCHDMHAAEGETWLRRSKHEERICFGCHDGSVASMDVEAEFRKLSAHSVSDTSGVHDPTETPARRMRHVECVDCHNPHASHPGPASSGDLPGALEAVRGVDLWGNVVETALHEYEICFACHGPESIDLPRIPRAIESPSILDEIRPINPSYHPIAAPGRNLDVPSLIPPWTEASRIRCSDCHNSDDSRAAGGTGPNGPHGSIYSPLLERNYSTRDFQQESPEAYALCYKCHEYASILNDESFSAHSAHVRGESIPCSACHDAHGISKSAGGREVSNTHLINFDLSIVQPTVGGRLDFIDTGRYSGRCYLACHGADHVPAEYGERTVTRGSRVK